MITIYPKPDAQFSLQPQTATFLNPTIYFTDKSTINITSWLWTFGNKTLSSSTLQHPVFTYADTGIFLVQLIATDVNNCKDTVNQQMHIKADYVFFAPNSFTPNDDDNNDIFLPLAMIIDVKEFEMLIFDRWGMNVFKSNDNKPSGGWDGRINNSGQIAQQDTYIWKVQVKDVFGNMHKYQGHVNLIR